MQAYLFLGLLKYGIWFSILVLGMVAIIFIILSILKPRKNYFISIGIIIVINIILFSSQLYISNNYTFYTNRNTSNRVMDASNLYQDIFQQNLYSCDSIARFKSQNLPTNDIVYWMEIYTCPNSVENILTNNPYQLTKINASDFIKSTNSTIEDIWFQPQLLGEKFYEWQSINGYRENEFIYSNMDSTRILLMYLQKL